MFESALASVFFCGMLRTMDLQRYSILGILYILVLDSLMHTYVYVYIYICICGYSISFSADFIEHQSFVSASHVFHMLRCTCWAHMCSKEILKLNKICSSTLSGDDVFLAPQFLLWRKDPSNLPIREVGGHKNRPRLWFVPCCCFHLWWWLWLSRLGAWILRWYLVFNLLKHHDCQGGLPPWLSWSQSSNLQL